MEAILKSVVRAYGHTPVQRSYKMICRAGGRSEQEWANAEHGMGVDGVGGVI